MIPSSTDSVTFAQQAPVFLAGLRSRSNPAKSSTLANWASIIKVHIIPAIGDEFLATFNTAKLKTFAAGLRHLSPKTQGEVVRVVLAIHSSAIAPETGEPIYGRSFNMRYVDLPRVENQKSPTIDVKAIEHLLRGRGLHSRYSVLCALLAGSALRISEALSIRVAPTDRTCWDAEASVIHVRNGIYRGAETATPKSRAGIRSVDLHPKLNAVLQAYAIRANRKPSEFLFATKSGRPVSYVMVARDLKSAGVTCGLHAMRRFRISQCRRARINEDILRFWVGHSARGLTDHYAKGLAEDLELRKASVLQAGLGFAVPDKLLGNQDQIVLESPVIEEAQPVSI